MGTLVEGSVSGSSERLTVSVSMIDPASQSVFENFAIDGQIEEWLDLRDELAGEVARVLCQRLGDEIRLREREAQTQSADALAMLRESEELKARSWQQYEAGDSAAALRGLAKADSLLARAESLDPSWVEPIVLRGRISLERRYLVSGPLPSTSEEYLAEALSHVERALMMNPGHAGALHLRGTIRYAMSGVYSGEGSDTLVDLAEQDLLTAVAQDPSRAGA